MRKLILLFFAVLIYAGSFSQAFTTIAPYQKTQQPAIQIEIPFPTKTVDNAINDKLTRIGYKGIPTKDYTVYKDTRLHEISNDLIIFILKQIVKAGIKKMLQFLQC